MKKLKEFENWETDHVKEGNREVTLFNIWHAENRTNGFAHLISAWETNREPIACPSIEWLHALLSFNCPFYYYYYFSYILLHNFFTTLELFFS
jgi:hypothetical protein